MYLKLNVNILSMFPITMAYQQNYVIELFLCCNFLQIILNSKVNVVEHCFLSSLTFKKLLNLLFINIFALDIILMCIKELFIYNILFW